MKRMDINTVISWGLVIMGIIAVIGWIILSIKTGTSSGTEIPIAIISGLGGVLTGKNIAENQAINKAPQSQTSQVFGQIADVATQGKNIVDAVDGIKNTLK